MMRGRLRIRKVQALLLYSTPLAEVDVRSLAQFEDQWADQGLAVGTTGCKVAARRRIYDAHRLDRALADCLWRPHRLLFSGMQGTAYKV